MLVTIITEILNFSVRIIENFLGLHPKPHFLIFGGCDPSNKLGCAVGIVVDSILFYATSGPNDYRKDAPPFRIGSKMVDLRLKIPNKSDFKFFQTIGFERFRIFCFHVFSSVKNLPKKRNVDIGKL